MTDGVGPIWAAGLQPITASGYTLQYLPDLRNDELQAQGKAPIYYWLPNEVRLARRNGDAGDYKFSFVHFAGVLDESTHVGVTGHDETAGGLLGFSTTTAPPGSVLAEAQAQVAERFRGNADRFWGWRNNVEPMFRPALIMSNTTSMTNLAPGPDGTVPAAGGQRLPGAPREIAARRAPAVPVPRTIPTDRAMRGPGMDLWYCNLQGQGAGSVSPLADNAYTALVGTYPAAMLWAAFHGGSSPVCVWQQMKLKVWAPAVNLSIRGDWSRIQEHFSAAAHAGGLFWGVDVQAEFNSMRQSGTIEVNLQIDPTIDTTGKLAEQIEKRSDLVYTKFMEQAMKTIFDPAQFKEEAAQASGGFLGWGGGAAVKVRQDRVSLRLEYNERREFAYLQDYNVSGLMDGLHGEIKADPANERKYFSKIDLGDLTRKVTRVIKPVVNWPDPARNWVGQPVSFLSAQIGYPNDQGAVQWAGHVFQAKDGPDASWSTSVLMKRKEDVANAPAGWEPGKTFVKRAVHFAEPPNEIEFPFAKVSVERNVVELDPEAGSLTDTTGLDVRVDSVGTLAVGPMMLNVDLEAKQVVEVTFTAKGKTHDGNERAPVVFRFTDTDYTEPRTWTIYTGQPDYKPEFTYQVRVIVKGSLFTKGMEWVGPPQDAGGNGALTITVPLADDPGVTKREIVWPGLAAAGAGPPPSAGAASTAGSDAGPPASVSGSRLGPPPSRAVQTRLLTTATAVPREDEELFRDVSPQPV